MRIQPTDMPGVLLVETPAFADERGFFLETYHQAKLAAAGLHATFVQDNWSRSTRGVLRGLHYQLPRPQGKLVRAVRGEVFDVAVDLRRGSPTFGRWIGVVLSDENRQALYIPPGFAHGLCAIGDVADVTYKCTDFYEPSAEHTLLWNDPAIGIRWPIEQPVLSAKDAAGRRLAELPVFD
jgi:dTDP-4-dehydrorhamnose 3,5-epimerase